MDARLLLFRLPSISEKLRWGSEGYEEARQWPLLPFGTMTAGDPIPDLDPRRLWIIEFCMLLEGEPVDLARCPAGESEEIYYPDRNSLLGDIMLALDLDKTPEKEWPRYQKRRMLRLSERLEEIGKDGLVDYLTRIASTDSVAMLALLGKILPRLSQVASKYSGCRETSKQMHARWRAKGRPSAAEMLRGIMEMEKTKTEELN